MKHFHLRVRILSFRAAVFAFLITGVAQSQTPLQLRVDLTDAPRRLLHVTELVPAHGGTNTFEYAQWIQGHHMPVGPIDNVTDVIFHAGTATGPVLPWRRDLVDLYSFHVDAPKGTIAIAIEFDQLGVKSRFDANGPQHYSSHTGLLELNDVILYPAAIPVRQIFVAATIHLPEGWHMASALGVKGDDTSKLQPSDITFAPVSVEQLIDSPIVFGEHCRQFPLASDVKPVHTMDVCADDPKELDLKPELLAHMSDLVRQATKVFQSHHYEHFDFVVAVSMVLAGNSLEHTQSAEYIVKSLDVSNAATARTIAYLLPHEYIHSWCGKYRRPIGLATPDYHVPMQDDLLWGYEGLTQYYGDVIMARAGFATPAQAVTAFEGEIATVDRPGRNWRPLQDTADAAAILRGGDPAWGNTRLGQDYYQEGALVWLETDVKIRQMTQGKKSLDDFAARFLGTRPGSRVPDDTPPGVYPYKFEDVVAALKAIVPYDWAGFLKQRLTQLAEKPPVAGLEAAGYTYGPSNTLAPDRAKAYAAAHVALLNYSIGFSAQKDGVIRDVWMGTPAYKAGLGPGDKLIEVNGLPYTTELMAQAVHDSAAPGSVLNLTAERNGEKGTYRLDWHGGDRFMQLTRNSNPDLLIEAILQPKP